MQQFELIEDAIGRLEKIISDMRSENEALTKEVRELKGIIDDRDLEILQLQEEAQKRSAEEDSEKAAVKKRLEGLLDRVNAIAPEEHESERQDRQA